MSAWIRRSLAAPLAIFLLAATAPAANARPDLDRRLQALAEAGEFAGAVVIRQGARVLYERGFGLADIEAGLAFSPRTVVETGSVTKPVTASAVLLLAERGELDLDARVQSLLPEYPDEATTVRHLLTHSGGLPDYSAFEQELGSGRVVRTHDLLRMTRDHGHPHAISPGAGFAYCNLCYDTLALLVERRTGLAYDVFVREQLLKPAGAVDVFLRPARLSDWRGVRIRGYRRTASGVSANDVFDNEGFYGGGNLYFSARDLAMWMSAWANRRPRIRPIQVAATRSVSFADGVSGLTLGNWYCSADKTRCYYPGHHQGFHAFGYWDSGRRLSIAFVSNGTLSPELLVEIPRLLIAAAEGAPLPSRAPANGPSGEGLRAGTYAIDGLGRIVVSNAGGALRLTAPLHVAAALPYRGRLDVCARPGRLPRLREPPRSDSLGFGVPRV